MIALPPGCTVNYHVKIVVDKVTEDIVNWYKEYGGDVTYFAYYDTRSNEVKRPMVRFRNGKNSYYMQDGHNGVQLDFNSEDAAFALIFLMKFSERILAHNMKDIEQYVY